jgi:hypothetical protein
MTELLNWHNVAVSTLAARLRGCVKFAGAMQSIWVKKRFLFRMTISKIVGNDVP